LNRPIARCSDKVSAIFAKPAASEMLVKQFPSLVKTVPRLARLAGHVFVAVQHHLGGKGRVAADLDRQVAPVPVEDVERVVVDKGDRLLSLDVVIGADIPYRRAGASDQDQNTPCVMFVLARYSSARSCLRCPAGQSITGMPCAL